MHEILGKSQFAVPGIGVGVVSQGELKTVVSSILKGELINYWIVSFQD